MATKKTTPQEEKNEAIKPQTGTKTSTRSKASSGSSATSRSGGSTKKTAAQSDAVTKTVSRKSTGSTSKKTGTSSAASKKSASGGSTATTKKTTKTASGRTDSTTMKKKPATGSKKPQKEITLAPDTSWESEFAPKDPPVIEQAPVQDESATPEVEVPKAEAPETEAPAFVPVALPSGALVEVGGKAISDARPPLDFPEKMVRNFFLRVVAILIVLVVLAASAFIYYTRPARYTEQTSSVNFLFLPAEGKTLILVNGTVRGEAAGELGNVTHNGRGDTYAAMIGETLYLVRGKNVTPVAEGVLDFVLAADGGALAYRTAPTNLFYRGTGKNDETSLISKNCNGSAYCLSANGKELAFTATDDAGVSHLRLESYSGNRPYIEGTAGLVPVAITNNSNYVYYTDAEGGLYVLDSASAQKIKCAAAPDLTSLIFNRDFTELLFTENGGTVLFVKGERRQIVGVSSTEYLELLPNRRVASRTLSNGTQYMLSSFYKNYFLHAEGTGKKLTYLDKKGNLADVSFVDGADTVTVTDKGVYFLQTSVNGENISRELYHVKAGKTAPVRIEWGVNEYCTNVDGSRVMFTGFENALYVWRAETGATRLCDSIVSGSLSVTADDLFCFYRIEGVLTVSDNGGELRDLSEGVVSHFEAVHVLFFATEIAEDGTFSVFANYRSERLCERVAVGVSKIQ